jgi:uncharacterized phage protein gp47/JayE
MTEETETSIQAPPADVETVLENLRTTIGNLAQENAVLRAQLIKTLQNNPTE